MKSSWPEYRLGALLAEPVRNGIYKKKEFHGRGAKIVNMGELFGHPRLFDIPMKRVELNDNDRSKSLLCQGDLLFARRSLTAEGAGKCTVVKCISEETTFESSIIRARPDAKKVNSDYLYYFFSSHHGKYLIGSILRQVAVSGITGTDLKQLLIPVPPLSYQKAVANILMTLDDKIALNRQMNTTLESMAQALFKSWFVDFDPVIDNALAAGNPIPEPLQARAEVRQGLGHKRKPLPEAIQQQFPDQFVFTKEMGWVPEGWEVMEVGAVLNRLKVPTRYKKKDVIGFGDVPVYEQGSEILLGYHNNSPDFSASEDRPAFIFGDHTCVTKLAVEAFSISENVIPIEGKVRNTYWVYYAMHDKQQFEEYRRHWMELVVKLVTVPCENTADRFSAIVKQFSKRQAQLSHEINTLSRLRDTLLPKLLSGELHIPDAEKLVAEIG